MTKNTTQNTTKDTGRSSSIADLRVYALARQLEDGAIELVAKLPAALAFGLANDLRRSASAVAHNIYEAHRRYSYTIKVDSLHAAIAESEQTKKLLAEYAGAGYGAVADQEAQAIGVIKQCWGLIKYIKARQTEVLAKSASKTADELVAARA